LSASGRLPGIQYYIYKPDQNNLDPVAILGLFFRSLDVNIYIFVLSRERLFWSEVLYNPVKRDILSAYGRLSVRSLLNIREHLLNELYFPDPYINQKRKENDYFLQKLPQRLTDLDAIADKVRVSLYTNYNIIYVIKIYPNKS